MNKEEKRKKAREYYQQNKKRINEMAKVRRITTKEILTNCKKENPVLFEKKKAAIVKKVEKVENIKPVKSLKELARASINKEQTLKKIESEKENISNILKNFGSTLPKPPTKKIEPIKSEPEKIPLWERPKDDVIKEMNEAIVKYKQQLEELDKKGENTTQANYKKNSLINSIKASERVIEQLTPKYFQQFPKYSKKKKYLIPKEQKKNIRILGKT